MSEMERWRTMPHDELQKELCNIFNLLDEVAKSYHKRLKDKGGTYNRYEAAQRRYALLKERNG